MYKKKQVNVMWCCTVCKMPLCNFGRGQKFSCLQEHQRAHEDDVIGCSEGRAMTMFILPWENQLYECKTNDINEDDDDNDGDNDLNIHSANEVGSSTFL